MRSRLRVAGRSLSGSGYFTWLEPGLRAAHSGGCRIVRSPDRRDRRPRSWQARQHASPRRCQGPRARRVRVRAVVVRGAGRVGGRGGQGRAHGGRPVPRAGARGARGRERVQHVVRAVQPQQAGSGAGARRSSRAGAARQAGRLGGRVRVQLPAAGAAQAEARARGAVGGEPEAGVRARQRPGRARQRGGGRRLRRGVVLGARRRRAARHPGRRRARRTARRIRRCALGARARGRHLRGAARGGAHGQGRADRGARCSATPSGSSARISASWRGRAARRRAM